MPLEPTIAESAKQRSLRVPLDYLAQRDSLLRTKWLATLILGGVALAYVVWLMIAGRAGDAHASPGQVASAHAAWNDDCNACHVSFRPLRSDAVDLVSLVRGERDAVAQRTARDQTCLKCHNQPVHHASEQAADVATCAACHQEHRGIGADIARPADAQCISCHTEIEQHREGASGLAPPLANITSFGPALANGNRPHPAFRSLTSDPGNIKFNHWLHLQPGIAVSDAKRKQRLVDLETASQDGYARFAQPDGSIQLDCSACHQPSERGDLMRPIAYGQHCQACHPLRATLPDGDPNLVDVPHGLPAERMAVVIDGLLFDTAKRKLRISEPAADESGDSPLIPGKTLGRNLAQKLGQDVLVVREKMAAAVAARCEQCHHWDNSTAASGLRDVLPANVPTPWFAHARFDHAAHRQVDCRTCHAAAFAFEERNKPRWVSGELSSGHSRARDDEEVMISGMETCLTCHAPRAGAAGGARHDCAECHQYHGRDRIAETRRHRLPAVSRADREPRFGSHGTAEYLFTAFQASLNRLESTPGFLGAASCASAGCHGAVHRNSPAWQSALSTWLNRDPHVQAYNVLWTFRGREMTRRLNATDTITEGQHRQAVVERCIGCHATPASGAETSISQYALGVECESCHGAAENWLHAHDRMSFNREIASGFVDTKKLAARAEACMPCHVGPNEITARRQVVDHDLIAAGHPRLNFEFRTYFESLPAHWDRQQDERRRGPALHYGSWLAGETKQTASLASLVGANQQPWPDFALLDCAACHHALGTSDWRQQRGLPSLRRRSSFPELPQTASAAERVAWSKDLFDSFTASRQTMTYDEAVRRYLAVRAVTADFVDSLPAQVQDRAAAAKELLDHLGRYLATDCSGYRTTQSNKPTQYELPTAFDPGQLADRMRPLVVALTELEASLTEPRRQP